MKVGALRFLEAASALEQRLAPSLSCYLVQIRICEHACRRQNVDVALGIIHMDVCQQPCLRIEMEVFSPHLISLAPISVTVQLLYSKIPVVLTGLRLEQLSLPS